MICVVLGSHKSGTTLVSEILHRSGIPMIRESDAAGGYDAGNFYERREWVHLNQDILGSGDPAEDHPAPEQVFARQATVEAIRREVRLCEAEHTDWGFKDPRTCLTYPIWREILPEHVVIGVYRSLEEAWGNHVRRKRPRRRSFWKVVRMWSDHNRRLMEVLVRRRELGQPFILLSYEALMRGDEEFERLAEFLRRELVDPRQPDLYRSRARGGLRIAAADRVLNALGRPQPSRIRRRLDQLTGQTVEIPAIRRAGGLRVAEPAVQALSPTASAADGSAPRVPASSGS